MRARVKIGDFFSGHKEKIRKRELNKLIMFRIENQVSNVKKKMKTMIFIDLFIDLLQS